MSDSESDLSADAEDPRVMKLVTYTDKHSPEETAAYLKELGGKDAIIYGASYAARPDFAMMHFLVMGACCFDEEQPLPPQVVAKKDLLRAATTSSDLQASFICFQKEKTEKCKST